MIRSGEQVATEGVRTADVCIVGAGPAGIAIARALSGTGARILMLESGGVGYSKSLRNPVSVLRNHLRGAQSLSAGETRGQPYTMLRFSRARAFGGSTNALLDHGLQTRPFDPIDFELRDGFDYSGWPIRRDDLDPYYAHAAELCGLAPASWDTASWEDRSGATRYALPDEFETTVYRYAPPGQFAGYAAEFGALDDVDVVTDATLVRLQSDHEGTRVRRAEATTLDGQRFQIEAGQFVLAAGALENARLLLLSDEHDPRGLGNQHDVVGRFFMEHPEVVVGNWRPTAETAHGLAFYERQDIEGQLVMGQLRLTDEVLRDRGLLNGTFELNPTRRSSARAGVQSAKLLRRSIGAKSRVSGSTTALLGALRHAPDLIEHVRTRGEVSDTPVVSVEVMAEQEPNRESRVVLGSGRDRLGMPRARLDWQLTARDFDSIRQSTALVASALDASGMGTFAHTMHDEDRRVPVFPNWHHMGTTRMHADPTQGVVDADSRVHGIDNLHIAGSSVFTTGGCSNPTLTLVALALRLGDHLARGLER